MTDRMRHLPCGQAVNSNSRKATTSRWTMCIARYYEKWLMK